MTGIPLLLTFHESRGPALASLAAAALRAEADTAPRDLPEDDLEAEAAAARAHLGAKQAGVIIRAQVADAWDTETPPRVATLRERLGSDPNRSHAELEDWTAFEV